MNGALVHTWRRTIPGRETKGLEVFGRALAYYDELAKEGRIHGHAEFFSVAGNPAGMVMITGDIEELNQLQLEDIYMQICTEASMVADDFKAQLMGGGTGDSVTEGVTGYIEALARMGIG